MHLKEIRTHNAFPELLIIEKPPPNPASRTRITGTPFIGHVTCICRSTVKRITLSPVSYLEETHRLCVEILNVRVTTSVG
jgi:hypothetical protein